METMLWVVLAGALVLAVVMAVVAWRLLRGDRERTEARATMLRQLAFEPEPALSERMFQAPVAAVHETEFAPVFTATADRTPPASRRLMAVGVVIVFMAVGAASVYGIYKPGAVEGRAVGTIKGGDNAATPLELISLSHRTDGEDFVVAGLVQNPVDGRTATSVMAVVYVFNDKGDYFASGKASIEFAPLAPGAESPFVVRLPKTSGVTRFRVGFRAQDGSVVAHVDHRGQSLDVTTPSVNLPRSGGL